MKYINLFVYILIVNSFYSQSNTTYIENVSVTTDSLSGQQEYNIGFKVKIQDIATFKSIELSTIDQNDSLIKSIGSYELKYHPNGFYYLESASNEKRTVLNNEVFFTIRMDVMSYNLSNRIRLKDLSNPSLIKTTSYIIPK